MFHLVAADLAGAAAVLDAGATEALRWVGGAEMLLSELGALSVLSLQAPQDDLWAECAAPQPAKAVVFVTEFLWDCEGAVVAAARRYGFSEIVLCSSVSPAGHAAHPLSAELGAEGTGAADFADLGRSLGRALGGVSVRVGYVPVTHCLLSPGGAGTPQVVTLCSPAAAAAFPLLLSHLGPAARAALPYEHAHEVAAEDVPAPLRARYKLLAHTLAQLCLQLGLNVEASAFAIGGTSKLVGNTAVPLSEAYRAELPGGGEQLRPASLVLIDRTLDLVSPLSHGSSLLDRVLRVVPRAGREEASAALVSLDVDAVLPSLQPSPLPPVPPAGEGGRTTAYPAVLGLQWQGGIALAHPNHPPTAALFRRMLTEDSNAVLDALHATMNELLDAEGCDRPPQARGRGAALLRAVQALVAGRRPVERYAHQLQLSLAVVEALQRSAEKVHPWVKLSNTEQLHDQLVSTGEAAQIVGQLCDLLSPCAAAPGPGPGPASVRVSHVLKLALRACSLLGPGEAEEVAGSRELRAALVRATATAAPPADDGDNWDWDDEDNEDTEGAGEGEAEVDRALQVFRDVADARSVLPAGSALAPCADVAPRSLLARLARRLLEPGRAEIEGLEQVGSALQQLGRMFTGAVTSLFGSTAAPAKPHPADNDTVFIFVVGGVTAEEVAEVTAVMRAAGCAKEVIVGGTTLATAESVYSASVSPT